jgi:hypothetical protein
MFLMVQNPGTIPLHGIRLLGLSSKRPDQIGQFGTGLKEVIALLIRFGKSPVIMSGTNRIDFSVQQIDGVNEVCFKTSEGSERFPAGIWHGLGMSPNFGKQDWNSYWQVLREVFCNAIDECPDLSMMYHEIVGNVEGKPNCTRVYIPADDQLLLAYEELPQRLLQLGKINILYECNAGRLLKGNGKCRIFSKGVYIQESSKSCLFHFEIPSLKLNESRSADWYIANNAACEIIGDCKQAATAILLHTQTEDWQKSWESENVWTFGHFGKKATWQTAFREAFGDTAMAVFNQHQMEIAIKKGYKPIAFPDNCHQLIKDLDLPRAQKILGQDESEGLKTSDPGSRTKKTVEKVWQKLQEKNLIRDRSIPLPDCKVFTMVGSEAGNVKLGFYRQNTIYLNQTIIGSQQEVTTILEEMVHHITKATDMSRDMQNFLLDALFIYMKL